MKTGLFFKIFLEFIQDTYDAENQILKSLPLLIQHSTNEDLKKGLSNHFEETKVQVERLRKIFELLNETPQGKFCKGMAGLIEEAKEVLNMPGLTPNIRDCFIIIAAQKVEHYEIAAYGSAISLVKHLKSACSDCHEYNEILDLLEHTLKEEKTADKNLTSAAEGKLFLSGVNDEIEKELKIRK